jgi:hypothetical protein
MILRERDAAAHMTAAATAIEMERVMGGAIEAALQTHQSRTLHAVSQELQSSATEQVTRGAAASEKVYESMNALSSFVAGSNAELLAAVRRIAEDVSVLQSNGVEWTSRLAAVTAASEDTMKGIVERGNDVAKGQISEDLRVAVAESRQALHDSIVRSLEGMLTSTASANAQLTANAIEASHAGLLSALGTSVNEAHAKLGDAARNWISSAIEESTASVRAPLVSSVDDILQQRLSQQHHDHVAPLMTSGTSRVLTTIEATAAKQKNDILEALQCHEHQIVQSLLTAAATTAAAQAATVPAPTPAVDVSIDSIDRIAGAVRNIATQQADRSEAAIVTSVADHWQRAQAALQASQQSLWIEHNSALEQRLQQHMTKETTAIPSSIQAASRALEQHILAELADTKLNITAALNQGLSTHGATIQAVIQQVMDREASRASAATADVQQAIKASAQKQHDARRREIEALASALAQHRGEDAAAMTSGVHRAFAESLSAFELREVQRRQLRDEKAASEALHAAPQGTSSFLMSFVPPFLATMTGIIIGCYLVLVAFLLISAPAVASRNNTSDCFSDNRAPGPGLWKSKRLVDSVLTD